jgi:hypothetical protein
MAALGPMRAVLLAFGAKVVSTGGIGARNIWNTRKRIRWMRYGLFVQRIEEAELRCKASLIKKIIQCDDWRAWRFYLINREGGDWKSEHIKSEISGPDGQAIPISLSPFRVEFVVPPQDPKEHFSVIDHSDNRLEDPSAGYIKPKE